MTTISRDLPVNNTIQAKGAPTNTSKELPKPVPLSLKDHQIKNYEHKIKIAKIVQMVGGITILAGAVGAALFFSAPVAIPVAVLVGAIGIGILIMATANTSGAPDGAVIGGAFHLFGALGLGGAIGGGILGHHVWHPVVGFVYSAKAAAIAGVAAGSVAAAGALIFAAGAGAEWYYRRKIHQLKIN